MNLRVARWTVLTTTIVAALAGAMPAHAQIGTDFTSRETSEGKNFSSSVVALLAVGESSGDSSYRYDIAIPEGRGVTPDLALVYSSTARYSEYGWGWELTIPMIERDPHDGVPRYDFYERYRYRNGHSTARLVKTGVTTPDGWTEFREETERTFNRYLRKANEWRLLTPSGTTIHFGTDESSRRGRGVTTPNVTAAWLARKIEDTRGNFARYVYGPDIATGNAQLRSIEYNGNAAGSLAPTMRVDLSWAPHWTPSNGLPSDNRLGYQRVFGRERLASIKVTAPAHTTSGSPAKIPASSPTERTTHLDYGPEIVGTTDRALVLKSVRQDDLPPVKFSYYNPPVTGSMFAAPLLVNGPAMPQYLGLARIDEDTNVSTRSLADVNGDGRIDLVDADWDCKSNTWRVWFNDGLVWNSSTWSIPFEDAPAPCALRYTEVFADGSGVLQDFVDLTGDGMPDMVYRSSSNEITVCRGNGHGFEPCELWADSYGFLRRDDSPFSNIAATLVDLVDLNGDGLPDRVVIFSTSDTEAQVHLGTGSGWGDSYTIELPTCGFIGLIKGCIRLTERVVGLPPDDPAHFNTRLLAETRDINGDGLPDFLTTDELTGVISVGWGYYNGFMPLAQLFNGPTILGYGTRGDGLPGQLTANYVAERDLVDMNADGLPDVVELNCAGIPMMRVRYNNGGSWEQDWREYGFDPGGPSGWDSPCMNHTVAIDDELIGVSAQLADVTGDGIPDFMSARQGPVLPYHDFQVRTIAYQPGRLLSAIASTSENTLMTIAYAPQTGALPFPIHAPVRTDRTRTELWPSEPARNRIQTTEYQYYAPHFDVQQRRFSGFEQVASYELNQGRNRLTHYGTGHHDSGLPLMTITSNSSSTALSTSATTRNSFSLVSLGTGRVFPRLDRVESWDGPLGRIRRVDYSSYNLMSGVALASIDAGWSDTTSDDIAHSITLVIRDDSQARLYLPSVETVSDPSGSRFPKPGTTTTPAHSELHRHSASS